MTHHITLPPELERKLQERAAATGRDPETLILDAVSEKLQPTKTFREIFAPLHEAFAEAPIAEDELSSLVEQARNDRSRRNGSGT